MVLFYCLPGSDLSDGIRELKNEQQLADFVATALGNGGHIDVYVEHHGYDIHDWFAKDNDDLEDYDEDECVLDDISSFVEEPQFIGEEEVIIPNRCTSDPFLNRLCKTDPKKTTRNTFGTNERNENALALVEDEQEDQSVDPIYKIKPGIVYPDHDPDQHWKDMVPILGMKFKDHEEMKMMLANYGVANGYQLWYKRNDYKSLLVLCGRNVEEGRCASKVGRKGIQKNVSKASKGKEKVEEGKGKEKVVVGNKKWTKQAIKLSKSPSKKGTKRKTSDNLCKFRLWGSWMQNEASFQIKTLIPEHNCARMCIYVDVALKDGWNEGCRKVAGLDRYFLKGTIKGELLTDMGQDANNQMFSIVWVVAGADLVTPQIYNATEYNIGVLLHNISSRVTRLGRRHSGDKPKQAGNSKAPRVVAGHSPTPHGAAVVAVPSSDRHHDGGNSSRFLGGFMGVSPAVTADTPLIAAPWRRLRGHERGGLDDDGGVVTMACKVGDDGGSGWWRWRGGSVSSPEKQSAAAVEGG
ncbi:hypothetical protein Tco_1246756 [Tanacetum coccineum]